MTRLICSGDAADSRRRCRKYRYRRRKRRIPGAQWRLRARNEIYAKSWSMRCFSAPGKGFALRCGDAASGIGAAGIGIGVFRPKIVNPVAKMNSTRNFTLCRLFHVPPSKTQGSAEIPTEVGVGIGMLRRDAADPTSEMKSAPKIT